MRVLVVDDDLPLTEVLNTLLTSSGYAVDCVNDGASAHDLAAAEAFDLVIPDMNLTQLKGLAVLSAIWVRANPAMGMILIERGAAENRVRGLGLEADVQLAKPFDVCEFAARVPSWFRRQARLRSATVTLGVLSLDLTTRQFSAARQPLGLPPRERVLRELFLARAGKVMTKEAIVQLLTFLEEMLSENAIEQYVLRLRRRIAPCVLALRTVRGLGYQLERAVEQR